MLLIKNLQLYLAIFQYYREICLNKSQFLWICFVWCSNSNNYLWQPQIVTYLPSLSAILQLFHNHFLPDKQKLVPWCSWRIPLYLYPQALRQNRRHSSNFEPVPWYARHHPTSSCSFLVQTDGWIRLFRLCWKVRWHAGQVYQSRFRQCGQTHRHIHPCASRHSGIPSLRSPVCYNNHQFEVAEPHSFFWVQLISCRISFLLVFHQ